MSEKKPLQPAKEETTPLLGDTEKSHAPLLAEPDKGGSVLIVVATVFFQSIGFTVTLPSMARYSEDDLLLTSTYYGWVVAIYSVGQFLGSPIFGYWSNHAPQRYAIVSSLIISAAGNILYGFVGLLPKPGYFLLLSRFLVGFGAGNVSVCRVYASEASTLANRSSTMAKLSAAQGLGFVIGPVIGTICSYLDFTINVVKVNKYTSPGFISAIFGIANVAFAGVLFKELTNRGDASREDIDRPSKRELVPMLISIFLFFVVIYVFSVFETMVTVVTAASFGWDVKQNGIMFTAVGCISVAVFIFISTPKMKKKDDRKMMLLGTVLLVVGLPFASTWDWPFHVDKKLTKVQFYIAAVIVGVGYPIASAYMFAIYSKVLNPSFQGTKMGWLTAGGSLARMIGPVWGTQANKIGGLQLLFLGTDALVFVALLVLIASYSKLGPHPAYFAAQTKVAINVDSTEKDTK